MPAAVAIPAIIAAASVAQGAVSAHASQQAAEAQQNAIAAGYATQAAQEQDVQRREAPFVEAGQDAESQLSNHGGAAGSLGRQFTMADFQRSPAYAANLQAAMKAIGNSGSARGGALSGGTVSGQVRDATNTASNSFGQAQAAFITNQQQNVRQLSGTAQQGIQAANGANVAANQLATEAGQNAVNSGNAAAAGSIGANKAWMGGLNGAMNNVMPLFNSQTPPVTQIPQIGNTAAYQSLPSLSSLQPMQVQGPGSIGGSIGGGGMIPQVGAQYQPLSQLTPSD